MRLRLRETTTLSKIATQRCRTALKRYAKEEDGVLIKPTIFIFLAMLSVGGIGIDLMRMERDRTELQYTLDRAVLAAADLDQPLDPAAVVEDYLDRANLSAYYQTPTYDSGLGYRWVQAAIDTDFRVHFMGLTGGSDLPMYVSSRAEEVIGSVEISMVLDVSGSMNSNNRLANLKTAAHAFINQVTQNTDTSSLSISIIPYATQVNAGETLLNMYNVTDEHNYSHCVNFIPDQFSRSTLWRTDELERTAHFDMFSYSENPIDFPVCPTRDGSAILPLTNDTDELHAYIDGLTARGNTSIDLGMKWGSALLDPSTRSVVNDLIADGEISASFVNRPTDYGSGDTLKVIILMSDGQNTNQFMLNPSMRTGMSEVWYNADEGEYSIHRSSSSEGYFWPHLNRWEDHAYGQGTYQDCGGASCIEVTEPGSAVQMPYTELLAQVSLAWNVYYNYYFTSSAWADWYQSSFTFLNRVAKDQFTDHICNTTKDEGVIVFAVGLEAPRAGTRVLKACASSPAHYFDTDGLEIAEAFTAIATSIRQLRLTQ